MNSSHECGSDRRLGREPIAIVGLSALYPKSRNVREFWSNIVSAVDCIEDVPKDHWDVEECYDPNPGTPDKSYSRRGGFIPEVEFDPLEFGLPPNTLDVIDVLQLLSLGVTRDLLADAGADQPWYDSSRTGVVLGVTAALQLHQPLSARLQTPVLKQVVKSCGLSDRDAEEIASKFRLAFAPWAENSFPGLLPNVVAGRIANRFDLGGMNMTVDAACASSLAAVRVAVNELLDRRSDTMIVGGCDAENTLFTYLCFSATSALSKTDRIRPFDQDADGTLIGEGIGLMALRRLADAERDGNRIYAVLRGIGTSSDGRFKSIYAPRKEGQMTALRRAYQDAGCSPGSVELFEAHGTGTAVGDATELAALTSVIIEDTEDRRHAAIGSVKSQIGHTKAAAGLAGMIKVALALYHKVLPPTINVAKPTTAVDFEAGPCYVNTETRPWIRHPERPRRRGAVSAMGFGGTNFHVVLEEYGEGEDLTVLSPVAEIEVWNAATTADLITMLDGGAAPMAGPIPADYARLALVGKGPAEREELRQKALAQLRANPTAESWSHPSGVFFRARAATGKVAAIFAGQGSQYVNLGAAAVLAVPQLRAAFDQANQHFAGADPLSSVAFPPPTFDPETYPAREAALRATEYAQPAIGALSFGQFSYLRELGFVPEGCLGHSFGELTALWAGGALDDDAFFSLARARGMAMAPPDQPGFDPGAMVAISASEDRVAELIAGQSDLAICNRNAPEQIVVGGPTAAVGELVVAAEAAGLTARRLPVAAAFHTPLVGHAVTEFRRHVEAVEVRQPGIPVFANTRGASYGADRNANRGVLAEQLSHPVDFAARIEQMYAEGFRIFVEFGPKRVLTQLVGQILRGRQQVAISLDQGPGKDADVALKQAVAQLVVLGLPMITSAGGQRPSEPRRTRAGMTIPINGMCYVSKDRAAAYQEAIVNGYRVTAPLVKADPVASLRDPEEPGRLTGLMSEHLALHNEYLNHQLETGRRLTGLLEQAADQGKLAEAVPGVSAAKEHSLAMGRTHLKASEVLCELAQLEIGATGATRATRIPGEPAKTTQLPTASLVPGRSALVEVPEAVPDAVSEAVADAESRAVADVVPDMSSGADYGADSVTDSGAASGGLAADEMAAALVGVVAEKTGYPAEMIDLDMALEADLGVDSIKRVEIVGALRDRLSDGAQIGPEVFAESRSLRDIVEVLTSVASDSTPAPVPGSETASAPEPESQPSRAAIGRWHAGLVQLSQPDRLLGGYPEPAVALVVDDGGPLAAAVTSALSHEGWRVRSLRLPGVPARSPELVQPQLDSQLDSWAPTELAGKLARTVEERIHLVIDCWTVGDECWEHCARRLAHSLLLARHLIHPLTEAAASGRAAFLTVTDLDGSFGLTGVASDRVPAAGVTGLVKTLAIEAPAVFCRAVDLAQGLAPETAAALVLAEAHDPVAEPLQVGLDGHRRVTLGLTAQPTHLVAPSPAGASALSSDDLLVVTGGGRGITAACVAELSRRHQPGLLLIGRTPLEADPAWASGVADAALKTAAAEFLRGSAEKPTPRRVERLVRAVAGAREIRATLRLVRAAGSQAEYLAVDLKDSAAVAAALSGYQDRITGLIHGAGVLADQLVEKKQAAEIERVFGPKLAGLRSVLAAVPGKALRHLVLFSSVAGFFGNRGQSDYAMANEVLNAFAASWKASHPDCHVTSLNWGAWDSGMVTEQLRTLFERRGIPLIPVERGAELFADQFVPERAEDIVTLVGPRVALSERPVAPLPGQITVERSLECCQSDPLIAEHRIGGWPVLPAVVALGWSAGIVERVTGSPVSAVRDFAVHKGIVFDGSQPSRCRLVLTPGSEAVKVTIHSADRSGVVRPHYAAVVESGPVPLPAPLVDLPPLGCGVEAESRYRDGTLFHGPALRGLRRILSEVETRLILECQLPDPSPVSASRFLPGLADLLLQACLVWAKDFRGTAALPLAIGRAEWWDLPSLAERFLVVVEPSVTGNGSGDLLTVTACRPDGQVLIRMAGVRVVYAPALERKFC